jgi:hypothetical protein
MNREFQPTPLPPPMRRTGGGGFIAPQFPGWRMRTHPYPGLPSIAPPGLKAGRPRGAWNQYRKWSRGVMECGPSGKRRDAGRPEVGKGDAKSDFFPDGGQISHLFPGFPTFSHLFPHRFFLCDERPIQTHPPAPLPQKWKGGCLLGHVTQGSPDGFRGNHWAECCNLVEVVSQPRQARWKWICVEKSAGCCGKVRGSARCYAQIRAVVTRLFGFLRVGPIFNHGWTPMNTDSERRDIHHRDAEAQRRIGWRFRRRDADGGRPGRSRSPVPERRIECTPYLAARGRSELSSLPWGRGVR